MLLPAGLRAGLPLSAQRALQDLVAQERVLYDRALPASRDAAARGEQCTYDMWEGNPSGTADAVRTCLDDLKPGSFVLVAGDSHGRDLFQALRHGFPDIRFVLYHQSSCPPVSGHVRRSGPPCFAGMEADLEIARRKGARAIVLASHWPASSPQALRATAAILAGTGLPVVVTGASPVARVAVPRFLVREGAAVDREGAIFLPYHLANSRDDPLAKEARLREWSERNGWLFVPKLAHFCTAGLCLVAHRPGTGPLELLFWDNQHLTVRGFAWLGAHLAANRDLAVFLADRAGRRGAGWTRSVNPGTAR